jgi:hypothetical protein
LKSVIWFFVYLTRLNGPEPTIGAGSQRLQSGALVADVLRPDVLRQDEELLELAEDVARCLLVVDDQRRRVRRGRVLDVRDQPGFVRRAAVLVLDVVLIVQAASAAVSGFPSDHFAFGARWNVQVRPSGEVCQLVANSG